MIRLILAVVLALAALEMARAGEAEIKACTLPMGGFKCSTVVKHNNVLAMYTQMDRVMNLEQATKYCKCLDAYKFDDRAKGICLGYSRACEFGTI